MNTGSKTLRFEDLSREPDYYEVDGERYAFLATLDFSEDDTGKMSRIQKEFDVAQKGIDKDPGNPAKQKKYRGVASKMLAMILPDVPAEHVASLSLGQVGAIVEWWGKRQHDVDEMGEATDELGE